MSAAMLAGAGAVVARGGDSSLTLSVAAFVPMRVAYTDEGLSVSYNGEALQVNGENLSVASLKNVQMS